MNPSLIPGLARTIEPPYHVVIFTSMRTADDRGYEQMARRMVELGSHYAGFLGIESARGPDGVGITVSYWRDEKSLLAWRKDSEHQKAQQGGKETWYAGYEVRIGKIERAYSFYAQA